MNARRAYAEVVFQNVDITSEIAPYLLQLTYKDNEEDATDDLQLRLQDRDGVWLQRWLGEMTDAEADSVTVSGNRYWTTAKSGLNIRAGPGTSYKRLGGFTFGTEIQVEYIEGDWAAIIYSGRDAWVHTAYLEKVEGGSEKRASNSFFIRAAIVREEDGVTSRLDCGQFELDSIRASCPPSRVDIRGTSLPYQSALRQAKRTKTWENCTLSSIAREIAAAGGLGCLFEASQDLPYRRVEQFKESDADFLSRLCHNAGLSRKFTDNSLILFDQADFEAAEAVFSVRKGDGSYTTYDLSIGEESSPYDACRVRYADPGTGTVYSATVYAEGKEDSNRGRQLEISARVGSNAEARTLAAKKLRLYNKLARTASFTFPGNPAMVAGAGVKLSGFGVFDGKYIVRQTAHVLNSSGYTTKVQLRKVLEGI